jgi:ABC transport system ATP-binding/permease protein
VVENVGGWEDYRRQRSAGGADGAQGARRAGEAAGGAQRAKGAGAKGGKGADDADVRRMRERERRLSYKEQRELEGLPERIASLEDEQRRLKEESASPEFYRERADYIDMVLARIAAVDVELHAALERWVELEALK